MKRKILVIVLVFVSSIAVMSGKPDSDPVLVTVGGRDIRLSEFEYLYSRNNSQLQTSQSPQEYFELFLNYKLKVADAIASGIDTTASFIAEYEGYCRDLAKPYLEDSATRERLLAEAYARSLEDVDVSHIMLDRGSSDAENLYAREFLDSLRSEILAGHADFDRMAVKYSADSYARMKNTGRMGWINDNGYIPYPFVDAAYTTAVDSISPVIDSGLGLHIVRVNGRRHNPGKVTVRHILKLTQGLTGDEASAKKREIDSIAVLVKEGADFSEMARRESEDPGSAGKGGTIDWFGAGQMVPEFEKVAFDLADGEISDPFATSYGYHIINKIAHRDAPSFEESRQELERLIDSDARGQEPRKVMFEQLRRRYGAEFNEDVYETMLTEMKQAGVYDSAMVARVTSDNRVLCRVNGHEITVSGAAAPFNVPSSLPVETVAQLIREYCAALEDDIIEDLAIADLPSENQDYRNLINEYHDGMLLFEISSRKVWNRASGDTEGLQSFFEANRDRYRWTQPKFKGYLVFARTDSVADIVRKYLDAENPGLDSLAVSLRRNFGKDVKIEKVLAARGESRAVDAAGFGDQDYRDPSGRWNSVFAYRGEILEQPAEAADVRTPLVNDYQDYLEREWLNSLHKTYKVKINKKLLKRL